MATARERYDRLHLAEPTIPDPDHPAKDRSTIASDWGSDLQAEAVMQGLVAPRYLPVLGQDGFIRQGFVHLLSASPKAGKTELLLQSIADWDHQSEVVYYFTEEYRDLWLERLYGMYLRKLTYEHVRFFYLPQIDHEKRPALIANMLGTEAPTAIIVDTIRSGLAIEDEGNNPAIRAALEPLTAAAHANDKTLILVHHTSKAMANSAQLHSAAGGLDFLGAVDGVINLSKKPRAPQSDTSRILVAAGRMRFGGELHYHWPDKSGPLVVKLEDANIPDTLGYDWVTTRQAGSTVEQLKALVRAGLIECDLDIVKEQPGKTYHWRRLPPDIDDFE